MRLEISGNNTSVEDIERSLPYQEFLARHRENCKDCDCHLQVTSVDINLRDRRVHGFQGILQEAGSYWANLVMFRTPTVDVLTLVTDENQSKTYVLFVEQFRAVVGRLVLSNVAGGYEGSEEPFKAAERELREELGLEDQELSLEFAFLRPSEVYVSPGYTNEVATMIRATITVASSEFEQFIDELRGKSAGVFSEGERIRVVPVLLDDALEFLELNESLRMPDGQRPTVDAKAVLSLQSHLLSRLRQRH